MHVALAKAKRDRRIDKPPDVHQSDPNIALCFAGATKIIPTCNFHIYSN